MTISELGSLGEFVSSFAVLASLIYLAIQVRQGAKETRLTNVQQMLEASREMMLMTATPETCSLLLKAKDYKSLTEAERLQYRMLRNAQMRNIETAFLMFNEGVLDQQIFDIFSERARFVLAEYPEIVDTGGPYTRDFSVWIRSIRGVLAEKAGGDA
ncbi:MAG: hypothetical protein H6993_07045 [Pseudomonadales bacterium]|nr:hypothetical protein [Pseudomonadales bacterium]